MTKLVFRKLYIFSSPERKAKVIEFSEGSTLITSDAIVGTDRGKSVILRALYHTMGAEAKFTDMWEDKKKSYILMFSVGDTDYYIYRSDRLFKVFDKDFNKLVDVIKRNDLAVELHKILGFAVKLPNRTDERLEYAPPVFNYMLYYLDSNHQDGSSFTSFKDLGQYSDFKENLLLYHFGVLNDSYYDIRQKLERLKEEEKKLIKSLGMIEPMLDRIYESLQGISFSKDITHLQNDISRTRERYNKIAVSLDRIRKKLISLRNDKDDLILHLEGLRALDKTNEKQITSLLGHTCPLCNATVEDSLGFLAERYNTSEDIELLKRDMQIDLLEIESKINSMERDYLNWLEKLKEYEAVLGVQTGEVNDAFKHQGLIEIRDSLTQELHEAKSELQRNNSEQAQLKTEEKPYNDKKKAINDRYYSLMCFSRAFFGLEEIDPKRFEKITSVFSADGSNKPIATVIWYINLIKIKNQFNPDAVRLPLVFDSPLNAESDQAKRLNLYRYILDNVDSNQLIVSGIGYGHNGFDDFPFDSVIMLENDKYSLLCSEDYDANVELLHMLSNK